MTEFKYKVHDLFNPTLRALHKLGGSSSVTEIEDSVIQDMKLTDDEVNFIHRGSTTKLNYRLRWARNYLKHVGLVENSSRGVWSLTALGQKTSEVKPNEVVKAVHEITKKKTPTDHQQKDTPDDETDLDTDIDSIDSEISWKEEVLKVMKNIPAPAFERLCQRLLRELGFKSVEVTGKPNDGGIDGKGILQLGGILSFHVVFQAKRFKDTVGSEIIRNFRGSLSAKN